jgi:hypothetical protein
VGVAFVVIAFLRNLREKPFAVAVRIPLRQSLFYCILRLSYKSDSQDG